MPDSQRVVSELRTALIGKTILHFEADAVLTPYPNAGCAVEGVKDHGPQIEIMFDDGIVLQTAFKWKGGWHLYRRGQKWKKRRHLAKVIIQTEEWVAVAFGTRHIETYREFDQNRHPRSGRMGPDLSNPEADLHECSARLFHYDKPDVTVGEALLDQRVMSGVGNVFRCEVLWSCGIHPWAPISSVPQSTCLDLVITAATQMRANLDSPVRVTAPDVPGGLAVYGRNGQKCVRCGDIIRVTKMGEQERLLYWCPGCQVGCEPYPVILHSVDLDNTPSGLQIPGEIL